MPFVPALNHLRRMGNARYFRVPFLRRGSFQMPTRININGNMVELAHPAEPGIVNDFLTCFIEDEYGLGKVAKPVGSILDIGANVGFFSIAARSRFPAAQIHAYEPNPRIQSYLTRNAETVQFNVFPEAVGATEGTVSLVDASDSNQARTSAEAKTGAEVRQVAFAEVVERLGGKIDLAKIDCEGAEWGLFTAPEPWSKIRLVRMEYHLWGAHPFDELEKKFTELGFDIVHHESSGEWGTVWCENRHF